MHIFLCTYPSEPPVNMQWFGVEQTLYRHTHTGHLNLHAFLHGLLLHARIASYPPPLEIQLQHQQICFFFVVLSCVSAAAVRKHVSVCVRQQYRIITFDGNVRTTGQDKKKKE